VDENDNDKYNYEYNDNNNDNENEEDKDTDDKNTDDNGYSSADGDENSVIKEKEDTIDAQKTESFVDNSNLKDLKKGETVADNNKSKNFVDADFETKGYKNKESRFYFVNKVKEVIASVNNLMKPFENAYVNNTKDTTNLRVSFLKSIYGNKYIAILGALGQPGNTVKVMNDKGGLLGVYKVLDSITGDVLKSIKKVKGNSLYDLYLFDKKLA
jgi:hypothetical protein